MLAIHASRPTLTWPYSAGKGRGYAPFIFLKENAALR